MITPQDYAKKGRVIYLASDRYCTMIPSFPAEADSFFVARAGAATVPLQVTPRCLTHLNSPRRMNFLIHVLT